MYEEIIEVKGGRKRRKEVDKEKKKCKEVIRKRRNEWEGQVRGWERDRLGGMWRVGGREGEEGGLGVAAVGHGRSTQVNAGQHKITQVNMGKHRSNYYYFPQHYISSSFLYSLASILPQFLTSILVLSSVIYIFPHGYLHAFSLKFPILCQLWFFLLLSFLVSVFPHFTSVFYIFLFSLFSLFPVLLHTSRAPKITGLLVT